MRQIARFAAVFVASLTIVGAAFAQHPVYRVKDLAIDKVAPTAAEAVQQARNDARLIGAQRLIDRLTLPEDRARASIDPAVVSRAYRSVQTQGEKSSPAPGGIRATGSATWIYREDEVRKYLDSLGVPYVDSQAGLALVVPVAGAGVDARQWSAQWTVAGSGGQVTGKADDSVLTPYVASIEAWTQRPAWTDIQEELTRTRANHGVIAEAYQQGAQYYIRLLDMRTNVPTQDLGVGGPYVSLQSAQAGAIAEMERAWKVASIVRGSSSTSISLVAMFSDIQEWARIRKGLETSRLVRDLNIESVSTAGADITFAYTGRQDQLAADLRSRGVDLTGGNDGWVLRIASSQ